MQRLKNQISELKICSIYGFIHLPETKNINKAIVSHDCTLKVSKITYSGHFVEESQLRQNFVVHVVLLIELNEITCKHQVKSKLSNTEILINQNGLSVFVDFRWDIMIPESWLGDRGVQLFFN